MTSVGVRQVVAASVDITPEEPLELFGRAERLGASLGVVAPIEANCLWIQPTAETPAIVVVSTDTLYGGTLGAAIGRELNLRDEQVLILGSHTHTAPGVDSALARLGPTHEAYVAECARRIGIALRAGQPERVTGLGWGDRALPPLFVNRRRPPVLSRWGVRLPRLGNVVAAPNRAAPADNSVRLVSLIGERGPIAVLWSAACHPVCAPDPCRVDPDFPGRGRASLRSHLGLDLPVLFAQGFSADVRPDTTSRRPPITPKELVKWALAGGHRFAAQSVETFDRWCKQLAGPLVESLETSLTDIGDFEPHLARASLELPGPWVRRPTVSRLQLSKDVGLVGVNAEVVSERTADVADHLPGQRVITAGCVDSVIGYWATDRMQEEGGYEGDTSCAFFPTVDWAAAGGPDRVWRQLIAAIPQGSPTLNR